MHVTDHYLAAAFLGFATISAVGCHDSTGPAAPTTGAIEITVSTAVLRSVDVDPDGYTLSVDDGPGQAVGVNVTVTIAALPTGRHRVQLSGLAPNCSLSGINLRLVDVITDKASPISFSVSCQPIEYYDPWDW